MNTQELLNLTNRMYANAESDTTKISYMNMALDSLSSDFGLIVDDGTLETVADQDDYTLPTGLEDISQIIKLAIANQITPSSRYDYTAYCLSKRDENPMIANSYYQLIDGTGTKAIALYPAPTITGLKIIIRYHKKLTLLTETNLSFVPEFDSRFHNMLALYCCHMICAAGTSPDVIQANMFMQKYDASLSELWKYQLEMDKGQNNKKRDNPQWHRNRSFSTGLYTSGGGPN